jgi:hypothetical protein
VNHGTVQPEQDRIRRYAQPVSMLLACQFLDVTLERILKQVQTAADIAADRFAQSPQLTECGLIEHQVVSHNTIGLQKLFSFMGAKAIASPCSYITCR